MQFQLIFKCRAWGPEHRSSQSIPLREDHQPAWTMAPGDGIGSFPERRGMR
jgi:hypothetical protein